MGPQGHAPSHAAAAAWVSPKPPISSEDTAAAGVFGTVPQHLKTSQARHAAWLRRKCRSRRGARFLIEMYGVIELMNMQDASATGQDCGASAKDGDSIKFAEQPPVKKTIAVSR